MDRELFAQHTFTKIIKRVRGKEDTGFFRAVIESYMLRPLSTRNADVLNDYTCNPLTALQVIYKHLERSKAFLDRALPSELKEMAQPLFEVIESYYAIIQAICDSRRRPTGGDDRVSIALIEEIGKQRLIYVRMPDDEWEDDA